MIDINSLEVGNILEIHLKNGKSYKGILLKRYDFADPSYVTIKLDNGYNISLKKDDIKDVEIKGKIEFKIPEIEVENLEDKNNILFISTGGTIASRVDYITGGVEALMNPKNFLAQFPNLIGKANIDFKESFIKFSENINFKDWEKLAKDLITNINNDYEGFIISHGTDTLNYSSSALAFILHDVNLPIAFTASQRSSDRASTDANLNVMASLEYVLGNYGEVAIVMHKSLNDDELWAIRAVNSKKMHSSRRDTFRPINDKEIVNFYVNLNKKEIIGKKDVKVLKRKEKKEYNLDTLKNRISFSEKVILLKYFPINFGDILEDVIDKNYKGIIIEGTGFGHINLDDKKVLSSLERAKEEKIFIGMTTQTIYGATNNFVYSTARRLSNKGVVYLGDMMSETALVKLSWLLAKNDDYGFLKNNMLKNYVGELKEYSDYSVFLR